MKKFTLFFTFICSACSFQSPPAPVQDKTPGLDKTVSSFCNGIETKTITLECHYEGYNGRFGQTSNLHCDIRNLPNPENGTLFTKDAKFVEDTADFIFSRQDGVWSSTGNWQHYQWEPANIIAITEETCKRATEYMKPWETIAK